MRWFLISEEMVKTIQGILEAEQRNEVDECGRSGCCCDLYGKPENECGASLERVQHDFNTGLHTTDAVPADFAGED